MSLFAKPAKSEPVLEVALAFADAINRQDVAGISKLMSKNHVFVDSLGAVVEGREAMEKGWTGYFRMVPDYSLLIDETYTFGPVAVMIGTARGTYTKDGKLMPENKWQTPAAWRATVQNGQVTEWRVYADNEPIRRMMASV
ncbi:MAG TPA: nuclear transport factor 2 family protein [Bryobacteraceae bacterium]|nr:nuclear transport factor 2 family protein [Bryobacteraceae bacterium]